MQIGEATRLLRNLRRFPEIIDAYRRAEDWRGLALRYLGVLRQPFPYELILRDGVQFRFESREEIKVFWNIFIRSSYCVDRDDRLILDAGANIGMFAVWAAQIAPGARIFSLEPWPSTFKRLNRHIEMNGLADRVVAVNVALAGDSGRRRLIGSEGESCANRIQFDRTRPAVDLQSDAGELASRPRSISSALTRSICSRWTSKGANTKRFFRPLLRCCGASRRSISNTTRSPPIWVIRRSSCSPISRRPVTFPSGRSRTNSARASCSSNAAARGDAR